MELKNEIDPEDYYIDTGYICKAEYKLSTGTVVSDQAATSTTGSRIKGEVDPAHKPTKDEEGLGWVTALFSNYEKNMYFNDVVADSNVRKVIAHEHDGITFEPWVPEDHDKQLIPTSGNYYLTEDVVTSTKYSISDTLNLCLDGHTIKSNGSSYLFEVSGNLNLYDCEHNNEDCPHYFDSSFQLQSSSEGAAYTVYGGAITGSKDSAIYLNSGANGLVKNVNFVGNNSSTGGAALYQQYSSLLKVYGSYFLGNNGTQYGGAIFFGGNSSTSNVQIVDGCLFEYNKVTKAVYMSRGANGGAICVGTSTNSYNRYIEIANSNFYYNSSAYTGGAIFFNKAHATMSGCELKYNYVEPSSGNC